MSSYWENRYRGGGASGRGSVGHLRGWKWTHIGVVDDVLDYGCGDLTFWEGKTCQHYTGVDISPTILEANRVKRPAWSFLLVEDFRRLGAPSESYDTALCLDVLFHIMDDEEYRKILETIFSVAKRRVVIYTWRNNPFSRRGGTRRMLVGLMNLQRGVLCGGLKSLIHPSDNDGLYQRYRPLHTIHQAAERRGFKLWTQRDAPDEWGVLLDFRR